MHRRPHQPLRLLAAGVSLSESLARQGRGGALGEASVDWRGLLARASTSWCPPSPAGARPPRRGGGHPHALQRPRRRAGSPAAAPLARTLPSFSSFSTSSPQPHWLDRWPAATAWLASNARALWLRALRERCAGFLATVGREEWVVAAVERRAGEVEWQLLERLGCRPASASLDTATRAHDPHEKERVAVTATDAAGGGDRADGGPSAPPSTPFPFSLDSRARAHLQAASLAAATVAVLRPLLRDDDAVAAALASHLGGAASPAAAKLLSTVAAITPDPYPASARRLAALRLDWGGAAPRATLEGGPAHHATVLTLPAPCLYATALDLVNAGGDGLPFLSTACCSADAGWLEAGVGKAGKASFVRTAWVGAGDGACVLEVTRGRRR